MEISGHESALEGPDLMCNPLKIFILEGSGTVEPK